MCREREKETKETKESKKARKKERKKERTQERKKEVVTVFEISSHHICKLGLGLDWAGVLPETVLRHRKNAITTISNNNEMSLYLGT